MAKRPEQKVILIDSKVDTINQKIWFIIPRVVVIAIVLISIAVVSGYDLRTFIETTETKPANTPTLINDFSKVLFDGFVLLNNEKYDEAEQKFDEAKELNPQSPDPWYWKAKVAVARGSGYEMAEKYLKEALKLAPDHQHSVVLKVSILLLKGGEGIAQAAQVASDNYGKSHNLDRWIDCLRQHNVFSESWIVIDDLTECQPPTYEW